MNRTLALAIGALCAVVLLSGCVVHSKVPEYPSAPQTIYQISEKEAFITVLDIYAVEMPKQSVDDVVDKGYRGYNATARFFADWTNHRVLVIPAKGTDENGREVRGYRYDIYSSGSRFAEGPLRHKRIREMIEERLKKTAIVVHNVQDGKYETDGEAYLGRKRDAIDIKVQGVDSRLQGVRPPGASVADRLGELKSLRDRGLITDEEYQAKRRQILDQM